MPALIAETADMSMPPWPRDAGAPAVALAARATGAFPTVGFIDRAMNQSCETVRMRAPQGRTALAHAPG